MATKKFRLEDKVNGSKMDLSMQGIVDVPLREMALYRRVSQLDLSNNTIRLLPDDFPEALAQLKQLDLSRNLLTKLPETMGFFVHLAHLDLYSNKIERLPLSFSRMEKLRWLDVKNNALVEPLAKICGQCLDTDECSFAAKNLVCFMRQVELQVIAEKENGPTGQGGPLSAAAEAIAPQENEKAMLPPPAESKSRSKKKRSKVQLAESQSASDNNEEDVVAVEEIFKRQMSDELAQPKVVTFLEGKDSKSKKSKTAENGRFSGPVASKIKSVLKFVFNWTLRGFLYFFITSAVVSIVTAMACDFRVIQKSVASWATLVIPASTLDTLAGYQITLTSWFNYLTPYLPIYPYIEPNIIIKALEWICEKVFNGYSAVKSIFI